jgi:mRNA-degrading endonuclease RelE of RelBE toxin-antitoxin system
MTWGIEWTPSASRDMRRLEHPTARRVRQAILVLAETGTVIL